MINRLNALAPLVLSLLRIVSGLIFLAHGTQKLLGFPVTDRTTDAFSLGWFSGLIEIVAGTLIAIGFQTRAAAFLASGTMAFAYWLAHAPRSPYPVNNGGDAAILYCFVFLYFVFAGGGSLSLDAIIRGKARA
ncbi:DoxX family protein [Paracoccus marinaquae]|uniref:DoxX family protein n=1 Tax=Paracoccus marinaquae TaxID=2841926 RepID=A0ABS6AMR9_9RHOB|nr:DoxX family protein [Paracoccus marinaquae]MBU3031392.1 DoxX family protein [Paracoccus marinaquae]